MSNFLGKKPHKTVSSLQITHSFLGNKDKIPDWRFQNIDRDLEVKGPNALTKNIEYSVSTFEPQHK